MAPTRLRRFATGWPSGPLPSPLHPDLSLMAQPGRTLVCSTDRKATSARRPPLHQGTGRRHPQLHPTPQSRPKTLRLAQNRRPNPRLRRTLLYTNFRLRTLDADLEAEVATHLDFAIEENLKQ